MIAALNRKLDGARYHVEYAFGILKGHFQIFGRPLACASRNVEFAILLINAINRFEGMLLRAIVCYTLLAGIVRLF